MPKEPDAPERAPEGAPDAGAPQPATPDDQKRRFDELIERLEGDEARPDNVIPLHRKKPGAKKPN